MKNRRSRLVNIASGKGFNAVASFQPENVFYLTNFWGEAIAICCNDSTKLIVPKLEASRAEQDSKDCEIIFSDRGFQLIDTFINEAKGKIVCVMILTIRPLKQFKREALKNTLFLMQIR